MLEAHTPPAVTADRDGRVVFYHGDTRPFLQQPSGEPTRDLLRLAREGVRGAVRAALQKAARGGRAVAPDGWADLDGRRARVAVVASPAFTDPPADDRPAAPDYFVVSFEDRGEAAAPAAASDPGAETADEAAAALRASEERLRNVLDGMGEAFGLMDRDLRIITQNRTALRLDGRPLEAIRGRTHAEVYPDADPELVRLYDRALADGVPVSLEHRYEWPGGRAAWLDMRAYPVPDGLAVFWRDISERKRAEQALRESEEKYRTLFGSIDEGFCIIEMLYDGGRPVDYRFLEANPAFEQHTGLSGAVGRTARELVPELDADWFEAYGRVAATGGAERFQQASAALDRWFDVYAFRAGPPERRQVAILFTDITARKRAEAVLKASEERQAFLLKLSDALRAEPDADAVTNRALRMLSERLRLDRCYVGVYRPEDDRADLTHQVGNDRVPPLSDRIRLSDFPAALRVAADRTLVIDDVAAAGGLSDTDRRNIGALGLRALVAAGLREGADRLLWTIVAVSATPRGWTRDEVALAEEVTERTWAAVERAKAEAALRASEERFRAMANTTPAIIWTADPDGNITFHNQRWLDYTGIDPADNVSDWPRRVLHPDDFDRCVTAWADALRAGREYQIEVRNRRRDGAYRWFLTRATPVRDGAGRVVEWHGSTTDIHEQKQTEAELRDSRAFHELVAGLGSDWWFAARVEPDGAVVTEFVSDGFTRLLGYTRDELMAEGGWARVVHPDDLAAAGRQMERLLAGETVEGEIRHVARDGRVMWSLYRTRPVVGAGGRVVRVHGVARDVDDFKRAADAVRASEARYRAIAANLPSGAVFVIGPDLRYQLADGEQFRAAGFVAADFEGKTVAEAVGPELSGAYETNYRRALAGQTFQVEHAAHDRHFITHGAPLRSADGRVTAALAVSYDITERKRAENELRAARAELEERVAERTAELARALESLEAEMARRSELARRLATAHEDERRRVARDLHDSVGQTLTGLSLAAAAGRSEQVRQLADALAGDLHEVAVRLRPTALDDAGLAAAAQTLAEGWARRTGVRVEFQAVGLDAGRLPAEVETTLFRAIQEALTNAAKHAGAGRVSVVVGTRGGEAVVVVEDDGVGFDPDAAAAPAPGRSGGLGLAGMRERVGLVGGTVEIESAPGRGTTVIARVPLPDRP